MMLLSGAIANGSPSELWTLARIAKWIEREIGQVVSARLTCRSGNGILRPVSHRTGGLGRRGEGRGVEGQALTGSKKIKVPGTNHRLRRQIGVERAVDRDQGQGAQCLRPDLAAQLHLEAVVVNTRLRRIYFRFLRHDYCVAMG